MVIFFHLKKKIRPSSIFLKIEVTFHIKITDSDSAKLIQHMLKSKFCCNELFWYFSGSHTNNFNNNNVLNMITIIPSGCILCNVILKLCNEFHFTSVLSLFGTEVTNVRQTKIRGTRMLSAMTSSIILIFGIQRRNIFIFWVVSSSWCCCVVVLSNSHYRIEIILPMHESEQPQ